MFTGVRSNDLITVGVFDSPGLTRGDDSDDTLTQPITAPLIFVTSSQLPRSSSSRSEVSYKTKTARPMSRSGIIKSSSKVPVSGVKGNMSYKITNTFITHLTETTVNTICVKRFLKREEFCIFSRVGSQCLLLRV